MDDVNTQDEAKQPVIEPLNEPLTSIFAEEQAESQISEDLEETEENKETDTDKILTEAYEEVMAEPEEIKEKPVDASSRLYKDNKFEERTSLIIYEHNPLEILKNFIKNYRYLFNLKNSINPEDEKFKEIEKFVSEHEKLYAELFPLYLKYNNCANFMKHRLKTIIIQKISERNEDINKLTDFVVPLGKVIKLFDIEENTGVY